MTNTSPNYAAVYLSPVGSLGLRLHHQKLTAIDWLHDAQDYCDEQNPDANIYIERLDQYFQQHAPANSEALHFSGTEFQQRVWRALLDIPYGETRTYGDIARQLNTSSRAVGQACRRNRIPIIIPCHRVVAQNDIGGFFGKAEPSHIKEWLLAHEA